MVDGSGGSEDISAALGLAMSGYPALALGYFKEPGLPHCLCSIPLEYFARAVSWLRAQPAGRGRPVVLYGASAGAEAVLLTASYLSHLADAVQDLAIPGGRRPGRLPPTGIDPARYPNRRSIPRPRRHSGRSRPIRSGA